MSADLKKVRRELEASKIALHTQTVRCRQLVAAFARKLQEKEKELQASHDLRDRQLARVLRSLLTLEARLRKEQKLIRQQLAEKDWIIEQQSRELAKWRQASPDASANDRPESVEADYGRIIENAYRNNPVLESVQQILLKDEEDLLTVKPVDSGDKRSVEVGVAWYESDSSVLPMDQNIEPEHVQHDDPLWSNRDSKNVLSSPAWKSPANCLLPDPRDREASGAWCIKVIEAGEELPPSGGHERLWVKDKTSPPTKAQHLEEKACIQMAKKTLTIAVQKDLKEIAANSITVSESSYQEIVPVHSKSTCQKPPIPQKPPALPPKPSRLLKPSEILNRPDLIKCQLKTDPQPKHRVHEQEMKRKQMNGHVPGNVKSQPSFLIECLPATHTNNLAAVPKAVEKQSGQEDIRPTTLTSFQGIEPQSLNLGVRDSCNTDTNNFLGTAHRESFDISHKSFKTETIEANVPIRMCSSVSSLITEATREGIVTELAASVEPSSPQSCDLSLEDPLQENFEEFKLEECYVENVTEVDARPEADGAEARSVVSHYGALTPASSMDFTRTYETFLETTGLSQKSILTPSRMFSNHRSCLKPKDVKHRSKVKAAAVGLAPTVKYWTEPFL